MLGSTTWEYYKIKEPKLTALRNTLAKLEVALGNIDDAIAWTDQKGHVQWCNTAFDNLVNLSHIMVLNRYVPEILPLSQNGKSLLNHEHPLEQARRNYRQFKNIYDFVNPIMAKVKLEVSVNYWGDRNNPASGFVLSIHDITEKTDKDDRLQYLSTYDTLTGLVNRHTFIKKLEQAIRNADKEQSELAVLYLDLDKFKPVNDQLGHAIGDSLLKNFANRIINLIHTKRIVARLGGDEFAIILPDLNNVEEAGSITERILSKVTQPFQVEGHDISIQVSIGIAMYRAAAVKVKKLIKAADMAMYKAKNAGGNRYCYFSTDFEIEHQRRVTIERSLKGALEQDQFFLVFQPKYQIPSLKLVGAEILLRWQHPTLGLVSPALFVPIAERMQKIHVLGKWILNKAIEQIKKWKDQKIIQTNFRLAINLSASELMRKTTTTDIIESFSCNRDLIKHFDFEVTETTMMEKIQQATVVLDTLRKLGFGIYIDDFGTGYSSLNYLTKLPVTGIKIDQSFLREITDAKQDSVILKAIINLGISLNLDIVAEGVETQRQLEFITRQKCNQAQGYFFSQPIEAKAMHQLLSKQGKHL